MPCHIDSFEVQSDIDAVVVVVVVVVVVAVVVDDVDDVAKLRNVLLGFANVEQLLLIYQGGLQMLHFDQPKKTDLKIDD